MSMIGKVCLVTGATAGIGYVTARHLAQRGAAVWLVGRSREKCVAAAQSISAATGNPAVGFLVADLSAQADVRNLARQFLAENDRLHVLVNNVGALFSRRQESADGIEMTLALNHLAPFLLTNLLLDALAAGAPARIVNVASDEHRAARAFDFLDPQARSRHVQSELGSFLYAIGAPRHHPGLRQYAQSKLANVLFTRELARRLQGTRITANALHPGFVASDFMAGNGVYGWFMRRLAALAAVSVEEGAKTSVHLATAPEVEGISGAYFVKQQSVLPSPAAQDPEASLRLWQLSEQWTGLSPTRTSS